MSRLDPHRSNVVEVVDKLNNAVRENPLAAGAIGVGLLWMIFGRRRGVGSKAVRTGAVVGENVGSAIGEVGRRVTEAVARVGTRVVSAADAASEALTRAAAGEGKSANSFREETRNGATDASAPSHNDDSGSVSRAASRPSASAFTSAKDTLSRLIEQEPLVVGGIGLAIGVGLAGAFPSSAFERSLVDEVAPGAQRARADAVEAVTTRAQDALNAMNAAAQEEGITPSAVKNSLYDVGARIGRVVQASKESIHRQS